MMPSERIRQGLSSHQQGRLAEAEAAYREALAIEPDQPDAMHLLGVLLTQTGRPAEGVERIRRSLARRPNEPLVHANLGNALSAAGLHAEALDAYEASLNLLPANPLAHHGRGNALSRTARWHEATNAYREALSQNPEFIEAWHNLALALAQQGKADEALACFKRVTVLAPGHLSAWLSQGRMQLDRGENAQAFLALEHALRLAPEERAALFLASRALSQLGRPAEAAQHLARLEKLDANHEYLQGARLWIDLHAADWREHAQRVARIEEAVRKDQPVVFPFVFFSVSDSPELQLRLARQFAARQHEVYPPLWTGTRYEHSRIRIAYLSEDFRTHPTTFLMVGLWEQHDRSRFEIMAVSLRPAEDSAIGRRAAAAFDRFIDASRMSDAEIAQQLRDLEVDILVDLMGYTGGALHSILSRRPAPVQVLYIGYPSTLGSRDADYLIADRCLIPEENRAFFSEQIVYLPHTYQPNDPRRSSSGRFSRQEAGLPEGAFVFCSFNNVYKINPALFDIWCRLLHRVPNSVLWLIPAAREAEVNLRAEGRSRGIDPGRLIFAPSLANDAHLARIALADLCLDTYPVSGATTTSDALWAGVPVITHAGRSFVSRMTASLLTGADLPELIAHSAQAYEELAQSLALDRERLAAIRDRLAKARQDSALFDVERICRALESAYRSMWNRCQVGNPPAAFSVPD